MANKKGITYYKLESTYDGDKTKYCGLTGPEIDSNFYFLRGNDIDSASYDKEKGTLTIKRLNGESIVVTGIKDDSGKTIDISMEGTYFDSENKALHLVINGKEYVVENFVVGSNNKVFTDGTLVGDGSETNILGLSGTIMTGFYSPAKGYIDTTSGETLPTKAIKGDVYVTKEEIGKYGLLYNYESIRAIENELKNTKWHVPSLDEWSSMLDGIESKECEDFKSHYSDKSNVDLGKYAGLYLKAKDDSWEIEESSYDKIDDYGFSAYPAGYADEWGESHNFGKRTMFWTSTVHEDNSDVWTKGLDFNKDTVHQQAEATDTAISLRLVKDIEYGFNEIETISGVPYHCVIMPYKDKDGNEGTRIWTAENVTFSSLLEGSEEYPKAKAFNVTSWDGTVLGKEDVYFINYWNGSEWLKKELKQNESITMAVGPDESENEDWTLIDGELIKKSSMYNQDVLEEVDKIIEEKLSGITVDADTLLIKDYILYVTSGVSLETIKGNHVNIDFDGDYGLFDSVDPSKDIHCTALTLSTSATTIASGETFDIKTILTVEPSDTTYTIYYSSLTPSVATVSTNGIVTNISGGNCDIKVTCDEQEAILAVTCEASEIKCTGITLTNSNIKFTNTGLTTNLGAKKSPSNASGTLTYTSDNESVATVDNNGNVTCKGSGNATITVGCTSNTGISKTAQVSFIPVESIETNIDTISGLTTGQTTAITATLSPNTTTQTGVTYTTSDSNVATVDNNGNVTIVGYGDATITISSNSNTGVTKEIPVSVEEPDSLKVFLNYYYTMAVDGDGITSTYTALDGKEIKPLDNSIFDGAVSKTLSFNSGETPKTLNMSGITVPYQYTGDEMDTFEEEEIYDTDQLRSELQRSVLIILPSTTKIGDTQNDVYDNEAHSAVGVKPSNLILNYLDKEYVIYIKPISDITLDSKIDYNITIAKQ